MTGAPGVAAGASPPDAAAAPAGVRAIAVAQTCAVPGDVAANVREHVQLARLASDAGAQVVLFPELSLTGYELERAAALAFAEDDHRLSALSDVAVAAAITVIAGAPVRLGALRHIGAFILTPDGTTALYTKRHLGAFPAGACRDGTVPPAEATLFAPGDRDPLVRIGDATAVVAVCADIGRPSHPARAAARGAAVYLASMFVIPSDYDGDSAKLRGHAIRHGMLVALSNHGVPTGGLAAAGRSAIWSGTGELLVQLPAAGAGVAVASRTADGWRGTVPALAAR